MDTLKKYWWLALIIVLLLAWYLWPKSTAAKKTDERAKLQAEYDALGVQRAELLKPYMEGKGRKILPPDVRAQLNALDERRNKISYILIPPEDRGVVGPITSNYQTNVSPMWWL